MVLWSSIYCVPPFAAPEHWLWPSRGLVSGVQPRREPHCLREPCREDQHLCRRGRPPRHHPGYKRSLHLLHRLCELSGWGCVVLSKTTTLSHFLLWLASCLAFYRYNWTSQMWTPHKWILDAADKVCWSECVVHLPECLSVVNGVLCWGFCGCRYIMDVKLCLRY